MDVRSIVRAITPRGARERVKTLFFKQYWAHPNTQWCRVVMNQEIERFICSLPYRELDVLEISGTAWGSNRLPFHSYQSVQYPEYDVCIGPRIPSAFDLIIAEQVLEHVKHPGRAVAACFEMLRPSGRLVLSTPFLIKYHPCPYSGPRISDHPIS
jgi:SAM-dependent methyltransferase